jgi:hypothetical protein
MDVLVAYMKTQFIGSNSGTTCIIVKIFEDNMIQSWNVGDSQVAIYVNNQLHYISCPHNMKNPLEQVRLADRIKQGRVHIERMENYVPVIATKTTMNTRVGEYIYFGNTKLAMSQALGDGWLTGIVPEKFEYTFDPADEVRIVGATDGYWEHYIFEGPDAAEDLADITTLPADELIEKMEQRWKKEDWQYFWNPKDASKSIVTNYDGDYDDIGLAIWSNRMPTDLFTNTLTNPKVEVETSLDADQKAALDLWQTLNPVKMEPLWTGDGKDPEFDAKALALFEEFSANKQGEEEVEEEVEEEGEKEEEDVGIYDDMPGLITSEEFEYFKKVIQEYGTLVELEQEYIRLESLEIKNVLIHCITIAVSKMSKNERKMKLYGKTEYELQEITNIEIELIKDWLAKE